ncbi:MAG TPA: T9SS type A sorting domain-containing protein, partial [Bacteroidia bacterium]|nr:T9SS type A sorting domain-containing protein [Bacteroidia bacterium]
GSNGEKPISALSLSGTTLLGICSAGGAKDSGCIFSIRTNGGGYKDIYDFGYNSGFGAMLNSLTLSGDDMYGILPLGGNEKYGVVFSFRDVALGVDDINTTAGNIKVYPNPSNGVFTLQWSVASDESSVEVYNVLGQQVYGKQAVIRNSQFVIELNQPSGVYLYRVIANSGEVIGEGKLVIEK